MTGSAHVVIAELEARPERRDEFVALATAFALECRRVEPGCRQFQLVMLEGTHSVLFFEAYDSPAAFEAHARSSHLARFQRAFQGLVARERPLRQGLLVQA